MTTPEANAKFFPQDSLWQKHCEMVAAYRNSVPPITSKSGWDGRVNEHPDYLAIRPIGVAGMKKVKVLGRVS